jgi:hypothetical protein
MKTFTYLILAFLISVALFQLGFAAPAPAPVVNCGGLPGCFDAAEAADSPGVYDILGNIIALLIKYVAVIAVIAVMIGGIMYLISSWDEEKTKKAKNTIIWALVGVFTSVAAWSLINIINNFTI